jgi:hypothetical protein
MVSAIERVDVSHIFAFLVSETRLRTITAIMNTPRRVDHDIPGGSANIDCGTCEQDAPSFPACPLPSICRDDSNRSGKKDDEVEMPNQSFIRQRNAIYSKRKYYKKKRFIDQLKSSKYQLEACNSKLRENNAQLETLLQRAKNMIAIKDRATAVLIPQEQQKQQLQALMLLQQQHQADTTLSNATSIALQQLSSIGTEQNLQMEERIPSADSSFLPIQNLTTSGAQTAITRAALQRGLPTQNHHASVSTLPDNQFLLSMLRNSSTQPTLPSELNSALSFLTSRDATPNTRSLINSLLLQRELEISAFMTTTPNNNSFTSSLSNLIYTNRRSNGISHLAMVEALKSLQDQQTARSNMSLQQIVLANEQAQRYNVVGSGMTHTMFAAQRAQEQLRQNQDSDHNSLLQYYLSLLNGRNS